MTEHEHPDVAEWRSATGADTVDYAAAHVTMAAWSALAGMFRPQLQNLQGCWIWTLVYEPENFQQWWHTTGGDPETVELILNRLRLWTLLDTDVGSLAESETEREIAEALAGSWQRALAQQVPDQEFAVGIDTTEDGLEVWFKAVR